MRFEYLVSVEVERTQGKFAPRDEIEEEILQALDDANPGSITAENEGEYEVTTWDIQSQEIKRVKAKRKA